MLQPQPEIEYPYSDGLPMSDKDVGRIQMENTEFSLKKWFARDDRVYVTANLLLYYVQGDPKQRVAPDVFVAKVPDHPRDTYKLWEEGRPPDVCFEFTSRSSRHLDPKFKMPLYEQLGVAECYLFDPEGSWLKPRFQAWHRVGGRWQQQDVSSSRIFSPALGLELRVVGDSLRLFDPVKGQLIETPAEETARADRESKRAERESKRADRGERAYLELARKLLDEGIPRDRVLELTGLNPDDLP